MNALTNSEIWQFAFFALVAVCGVAALLRSHRALFLVVGAMLFIAALGLTTEVTQRSLVEYRTFLFPLQLRRAQLFIGLGGVLMLGLFFYLPKLRFNGASSIGAAFIALGVYMGMIHIVHDPVDGLQTLLVAVFTIVPIVFALTVLLDEWDDLYRLMRALALTGGAWTVACTAQFLINKSVILTNSGRRFCGLLGNPQHAGVFAAGMSIICAWLVLNDPKMRYRAMWGAIGASHMVFVAWTGSRTSLLSATLGLSIALFARLGRAVLFAPVIVGTMLGLISIASAMGVEFGFERLVTTSDTRSEAWSALLQQIRYSPLIGVGPANQTFSENSFLLAWSCYGVGAFVLLVVACLVSVWHGLRLIRVRFQLPKNRRALVDLVCGLMGAYWLGTMAEGYGTARVSTQIVFILTAGAMSTRLVELAARDREASTTAGLLDENGQPYDGYEWYGEHDERPSAA